MDEFMKIAIQEAKEGLAEGGIPIGSALVNLALVWILFIGLLECILMYIFKLI